MGNWHYVMVILFNHIWVFFIKCWYTLSKLVIISLLGLYSHVDPQNFNFQSNCSVYITVTLEIWVKFGCLGVVNLDVDIDQLLILYGDSY